MKLLALRKLRTNRKIIDHIQWHVTPAMVAEIHNQQEIHSLKDLLQFKHRSDAMQGYFFYIEVWDGIAHLLLKEQGKNISKVVGKIEEIPEKMLLDALEEAGGSLREQGSYPITGEIKACLLQHLEAD